MKFLLLAFPQTVILILTIKIKGFVLYPKDEPAIQNKATFSPDKGVKPLSSTGHHDVFISHAQADKPVADAVCARLEAANIRCWIAPRDVPPGKDFPEAIIEGIEGSRVMVLIFSSHSNNSKHVIRELTSAVNKGLVIVPFRIEDIIPSKSMEYLINIPHWLDALTPPLEQHLETLTDRIVHILQDIPLPEK
ncbi:MAG: toll/interleukin-1 receptor domain-containing protein [Methanoregula sp.]|nr:MAG: toll/interleukin-1 receptor domain-containing protein [Methanoregula sp.]